MIDKIFKIKNFCRHRQVNNEDNNLKYQSGKNHPLIIMTQRSIRRNMPKLRQMHRNWNIRLEMLRIPITHLLQNR
jgi:hypothetical protein